TPAASAAISTPPRAAATPAGVSAAIRTPPAGIRTTPITPAPPTPRSAGTQTRTPLRLPANRDDAALPPLQRPRAPAPKRPPIVPAAPSAVGPAITILLLGSDQRPDEQDGAHTDAIMVVRIDPQHQRVALLSITRDLMVDIPGYGQARINAAYAYGG